MGPLAGGGVGNVTPVTPLTSENEKVAKFWGWLAVNAMVTVAVVFVP